METAPAVEPTRAESGWADRAAERRRRSAWRTPRPLLSDGEPPSGGERGRGGGAAALPERWPDDELPPDVRRARRMYLDDREGWRAELDAPSNRTGPLRFIPPWPRPLGQP